MLVISSKFKSRIRLIILVMVCILIYSWGIICGLDMWLKCAILERNEENVISDVYNGNLTSVSMVTADGDFQLVGSDKVYTSSDISEYIRVPSEISYFYNTESKQFVSRLTNLESRNIILKYIILDLVCFCISLVLIIYTIKGRIWKRVLFYIFFVVRELYSYICYYVALDVLFNVKDEYFLILLGKLLITISLIFIRNVVLYVRGRRISNGIVSNKKLKH